MTASYFPSPAADYIESALTVTAACDISANSQVIQTDRGYVVLDLSLKVTQGSVVLIRLAGELQFAKLMGSSLSQPKARASKVRRWKTWKYSESQPMRLTT
jgi:hypothetical protein